ncbi:MAG: hypothetical protein J0H08_07565 [Rhizobiales bacterium]|nr:hypothetical protein [Hyphomicrobiales bacterium]
MVVVKRPASPDYGSEVDAGEKVLTPANNARAGVAHHNVRNVLIISTLGVVVLFGLIYLLFFAG